MSDIKEPQTNSFLRRLGIRLLKASSCSSPYDRENFLELDSERNGVIFDVGAKAGQSSLWFAQNFPAARIYAFEAAPSVFKRLQKNTLKYSSIQAYECTLGSQPKHVMLSPVKRSRYQTTQIAAPSTRCALVERPVDRISISTLDNFCVEESIDTIHVLKVETEGHEIEVLQGAKKLLEAGRIQSILVEASVLSDDAPHISLVELKEFLRGFGFRLFSRYDLHHTDGNGRLSYFSALFKPR